jgi:hypothetical protein
LGNGQKLAAATAVAEISHGCGNVSARPFLQTTTTVGIVKTGIRDSFGAASRQEIAFLPASAGDAVRR